MLRMDQYNKTIDTMYPDGYQRERIFRDSGDMVDPKSASVARGFFARFFERIALNRAKRVGRLALRELSEEQLVDIGITRDQAFEEAQKASLFSWPPRSL